MKYSVALAALVAVASAQTLADIPDCALKCLDASVTKLTTCDTKDVPCICKSFDKIQGDATGCILAGCGADVALQKVLPAAQKLCANGGNSGTTAAPGTTAAATTTAVATTAPATSAPASSAPASSAPASSAPHSSAPASSAPAATTIHTVPTGTGAPTNGTGKPTGVPVGGAAGLASMGAVGMLALAALAL